MAREKMIKQEYTINSSAAEVWKALTDVEFIDRWGGGPAKMDDKVGTEFSLWGGDIYGKNIEVVKNKKLVQEWYGGDWAKPSIVVFKLEENNAYTKVTLEHADVPEDEIKNIDNGWQDYYMGPLKEFLESNK